MVHQKRPESIDAVLSGPCDQGETFSEAAVRAVVEGSSLGVRPLCHQDLVVVTEKRLRGFCRPALGEGSGGEGRPQGALVVLAAARPEQPVVFSGGAADLVSK